MNRDDFIKKLFEGAALAGITECEAYFSDAESFDVDVLEGEIKDYSVSESKGETRLPAEKVGALRRTTLTMATKLDKEQLETRGNNTNAQTYQQGRHRRFGIYE